MTPIAYLMNGIRLLCYGCYLWKPDGAPALRVYGTCIDRPCDACKKPIEANRQYGRAAWRDR